MAQIMPTQSASDSDVTLRTRAQSATKSIHAVAVRTSTVLHRSQPLLVLWGLVVLGFHIHATSSSQSSFAEVGLGCKSVVHPWLVARLSCSVLEINCVARDLTGTESEIDAALSQVEPTALSSLIITHCSALTIPSRLQTLTNLIGLEVTNASLVEWGDDAALHDANHKTLHFLSLVRMNITQIPDGILAEDFPHALRDIHIVATNLSVVPDDLDLVWHNTINLYLERNQLTSVPETVARMRVERLSLMGNDIHSIPDQLFDGNAFHVLSLARNPITKVPASLGSRVDLKGVVLDFTLIETLPQWLMDASVAGTVTVLAGGTPYCSKRLTQTNSFTCSVRTDDAFEAYAFTQNLVDRKPI